MPVTNDHPSEGEDTFIGLFCEECEALCKQGAVLLPPIPGAPYLQASRGEPVMTSGGGNLISGEVIRNERAPQCGVAKIEDAYKLRQKRKERKRIKKEKGETKMNTMSFANDFIQAWL